MAGNFEPSTKFFTSRGRLEKQKQQNEFSNKPELLYKYERRREELPNLFAKQQIFQLAYFSFIAAINLAESNEMHGAVLLEMVKSLLV